MFIVWGTKPTTKRFEKEGLEVCPVCGEQTKMNYIEQRTWFTLFWIPLIPFGGKYFVGCPKCERYRQADKVEFKQDKPLLTQIIG